MSGCRNLSHPAAAPRRCRSRLRLPHGSLTFCVAHRSARWQQPCSQGSLCASNRQAQSQGCQALGALSGTSPWKRRPEVREPAFPGPLPSHRGLPGHLVQAQPPPLPQPHASEAPCSRTFPARPPEKVKEGAAAAPRSEASEGVLSPSGRTEEKGRLWGLGEARWAPERRAALPSVSRPSLLCLIDLAVTFRVRPDRRRCLVNVSAAF